MKASLRTLAVAATVAASGLATAPAALAQQNINNLEVSRLFAGPAADYVRVEITTDSIDTDCTFQNRFAILRDDPNFKEMHAYALVAQAVGSEIGVYISDTSDCVFNGEYAVVTRMSLER